MRRQIERDGSRAALVIVEDNPGDARLFREYLSEADIDNPVHHVSTVDDALDCVHQRGEFADGPAPDLLFLDWHLPTGTGDEIVEHLQDDPGTVDAFTVVLTGSRRRQGTVVPSEPGVDGYLTKPIETDELIELVEDAAGLSLAPADD